VPTSYEIPPYGSSASRLHGWLSDCISEGENWLASQRPSKEWKSIVELLGANLPDLEAHSLSNTEYNKSLRVARELVAGLGSFRHDGEFKPQSSKDLYDAAHALTLRDRAWNRETHAFLAYRQLLQYAVSLGTGYGVCTWDKHFHSPFRGDVRLDAFAPDQVTFIQLPRDGDLQRAYVVLLRYELPINLARAIYSDTNPAFAAALTPDRDTPNWMQKGLEKVQTFLAPALRVAGRRPGESQQTSFPTVDVFHAYTCDRSLNESGAPRTMGAWGTNWSYTVPALGDPIPVGVVNPATGQSWTRPAEPRDCLLFPLRRLTIFARSTEIIGFDESSPWWHGKAPVVRLRFDDWPWEALGRSLIGPIRTIQTGINHLMRDIEDSAAARLNPPVLYDENLTSPGFAEAFNPRRAGVRAAANLNQGDVLKYPVDSRHYDVPEWIPDWIKQQEGRADYLTGVQDLTAIAKAKQLPSSDAIEKLLEMAGPLVQDMVRLIEEPLRDLGELRKAYYFQFDTYSRLLTTVGDDGEDMDWEFTPDLLVPLIQGELLAARRDRQRRYLHEFRYSVTQSGISEINRMTTKLFYLNLMTRSTFPLDWWTFNKVARIENFGAEPEGTHTVLERWVAQQRLMGELAEEMGGAAGGGKSATGRPPTNARSPRLATKDGGTRSTIATSR
jgi:hypothetical protein